jgi:pimeloyl-ACP methyl ester carboxylesterase
MLRFSMIHRCSTAAIFLLLAASTSIAQPPQARQIDPVPSNLTIFVQGRPVGSEQVTVSSSADGWTIRATGRLGAPVNLTTTRLEVTYDRDWKPLTTHIEGSLRGQPLLIHTAFSSGNATSEIMQAGQQSQKTDKVSADTLVLPNMFFSAYEALAFRLADTKPGTELRAYVLPQAEVGILVRGVAEERIKTPVRTVVARRFDLSLVNPDGPVPAEVWIDESNRLLRFRVNAQGLEVARDDVAAVSSRVERMTRTGDEPVRMPANGFTLVGTLSRPATTATPARTKRVPRLPTVILVPGSGLVDRDETVAGIPVFAQLANAIADAGFLVVRYDKRGVGQSGGRNESATVDDFAEDVRAVVKFLRRRKDVDERRIAIVGHSEGGYVSMLAASREQKSVAALALIATPASTGAELVLEQQLHALDGMQLPEGDKRARIELQQRIQQAVVTGTGWEAVPPELRRQAENPWFRSFLVFDPARVMPKIEAPILVVQGDRDRQVPVRHASRLIEMAKARKANWGAELVIVEGINHLLVPAPTGEVTEYATLQDKTVGRQVLVTLTNWLRKAMPERAAGKK